MEIDNRRYQEQLKSDPCYPYYTPVRLKKPTKLAIWELDPYTLKRLYRKTKKEEIEELLRKKLPPWQSEYDDAYNKTAQIIIRANKKRIFFQKKAMRKKNKT